MPAQTYVIPLPKLTRYLLNVNHPRGGPKAQFFLQRGFTLTDPMTLGVALFQHAIDYWPGVVLPQPYGQSHECVGPMLLPDGTTRRIMSVWKIEAGQTMASLLTAHPH